MLTHAEEYRLRLRVVDDPFEKAPPLAALEMRGEFAGTMDEFSRCVWELLQESDGSGTRWTVDPFSLVERRSYWHVGSEALIHDIEVMLVSAALSGAVEAVVQRVIEWALGWARGLSGRAGELSVSVEADHVDVARRFVLGAFGPVGMVELTDYDASSDPLRIVLVDAERNRYLVELIGKDGTIIRATRVGMRQEATSGK